MFEETACIYLYLVVPHLNVVVFSNDLSLDDSLILVMSCGKPFTPAGRESYKGTEAHHCTKKPATVSQKTN